MKWSEIPHEVRDEFFDYFASVHDEEEEWMAPGSDECKDESECLEKIGDQRMWEIYQEFLAQASWETRQAAQAVSEEEVI